MALQPLQIQTRFRMANVSRIVIQRIEIKFNSPVKNAHSKPRKKTELDGEKTRFKYPLIFEFADFPAESITRRRVVDVVSVSSVSLSSVSLRFRPAANERLCFRSPNTSVLGRFDSNRNRKPALLYCCGWWRSFIAVVPSFVQRSAIRRRHCWFSLPFVFTFLSPVFSSGARVVSIGRFTKIKSVRSTIRVRCRRRDDERRTAGPLRGPRQQTAEQQRRLRELPEVRRRRARFGHRQ